MKPIYLLFWLSSVYVAYWFGSNGAVFSTQVQDGGLQVVANNVLQTSDIKGSKELYQPIQNSDQVENRDTEVFNLEDINQKIRALDIETYSLKELAQLYHLLSQVADADLKRVLSQLPDEFSNATFSSYAYLLSRLARIDGESALQLLQTANFDKHYIEALQASLFASWIGVDAEKAMANYFVILDQLPNKKLGFSGQRIFQALAQQNLSMAIEKVVQLQNEGFDIGFAFMGISSDFTEQSQYEAMMNQVLQLDKPALLDKAFSAWANKQPEEAATWVHQVTDSAVKASLNRSVYFSWSRKNFEQAANWYFAQLNSGNRQKDLASLIRSSISIDNPQQLLSWVEKQPQINLDQARSKVIRNVVHSAPEFAEQNLDLVIGQRNKESVAWSIYAAYKRISTKKAQQYLSSSPYRESIEETERKFQDG